MELPIEGMMTDDATEEIVATRSRVLQVINNLERYTAFSILFNFYRKELCV